MKVHFGMKPRFFPSRSPHGQAAHFITSNMCDRKWGRLPVWDGQASIHSPLQSTEHLVACGGSSKPSIQVAGESAWLTVNALHVELVACHVQLALVHLIQAKLVQQLRTENC